MLDGLLMPELEILDVQLVGQRASFVDQLTGDVIVSRPDAPGIQIRQTDEKLAEDRTFDQDQRQDAANLIAIFLL